MIRNEWFIGEYEATLDAKGRFLLPAGFKKQLPEEAGSQFVMNRGFEKVSYPVSREKLGALFSLRSSKLNDFDPQVREFRRYFLNGATVLELDSAGSIAGAAQFERTCRPGKRYCAGGGYRTKLKSGIRISTNSSLNLFHRKLSVNWRKQVMMKPQVSREISNK